MQQLVKSVEFRRNPSDPNYVVITRTYLIERAQLGPVTRAAFKQTVTDSTGYQWRSARSAGRSRSWESSW